MIKRRRRGKRGLQRAADVFALALMYEASGGTVGRAPALKEGEEAKENPVPFKERRALLDSVTKLLAGQPPSDDDSDEDGISDFRSRLNDDGDSGESSGGADPDDPA